MASQIIASFEHPITQIKVAMDGDAVKLYTL